MRVLVVVLAMVAFSCSGGERHDPPFRPIPTPTVVNSADGRFTPSFESGNWEVLDKEGCSLWIPIGAAMGINLARENITVEIWSFNFGGVMTNLGNWELGQFLTVKVDGESVPLFKLVKVDRLEHRVYFLPATVSFDSCLASSAPKIEA